MMLSGEHQARTVATFTAGAKRIQFAGRLRGGSRRGGSRRGGSQH